MTPREAVLTEERKTVALLIAREVGVNGWIARSHPHAARLEQLVTLIGHERWRANVDRSTLPSFTDGTVWDPDELAMEMAS